MIIKDLIMVTNFEEIAEYLVLYYGENDIPKYQSLYNKLMNIQPNENVNNITISIKAFLETEDDSVVTEKFDENDPTLNFDVSATVFNEEIVYSIAGSSYADFTGYLVESQTLGTLSPKAILAHCLWEITSYSFKDNTK